MRKFVSFLHFPFYKTGASVYLISSNALKLREKQSKNGYWIVNFAYKAHYLLQYWSPFCIYQVPPLIVCLGFTLLVFSLFPKQEKQTKISSWCFYTWCLFNSNVLSWIIYIYQKEETILTAQLKPLTRWAFPWWLSQ